MKTKELSTYFCTNNVDECRDFYHFLEDDQTSLSLPALTHGNPVTFDLKAVSKLLHQLGSSLWHFRQPLNSGWDVCSPSESRPG